MRKLIRRMARVADSSQVHLLWAGKSMAGERVVEGHVPVDVGDEMERFVVRADLLGQPAFVELLRRSAQEYGYDQVGVLRIPCTVDLFRRVLLASDAGETLSATDLAGHFVSVPN
ncbi:hypothetical protein HPP92_003754 [Vanilla planifolia]|uniref:Small auxin up regulated protein n=1 Tax=Vanilla planifolia TaxID=51239 RepID=A0A835VJN6_VANPL|nr:hypothetical protein HPP92_004184 [Vanilla planifolia]KAG0503682.1 hypothetical protein HPP92_003754 [Vanilla planifolia]